IAEGVSNLVFLSDTDVSSASGQRESSPLGARHETSPESTYRRAACCHRSTGGLGRNRMSSRTMAPDRDTGTSFVADRATSPLCGLSGAPGASLSYGPLALRIQR